jgi:hypothetical protein
VLGFATSRNEREYLYLGCIDLAAQSRHDSTQ